MVFGFGIVSMLVHMLEDALHRIFPAKSAPRKDQQQDSAITESSAVSCALLILEKPWD